MPSAIWLEEVHHRSDNTGVPETVFEEHVCPQRTDGTGGGSCGRLPGGGGCGLMFAGDKGEIVTTAAVRLPHTEILSDAVIAPEDVLFRGAVVIPIL